MTQKKLDIVTWLKQWFPLKGSETRSLSEVVSDFTTSLNGKVDTEAGKGLSTNDYTTSEKTKLANIETGANKTTVDTALSSTSTNPVQNKVINTALNGKAESTHTHTTSNITDFPSTMTPSSHTHGDITNDGKVGTTANKPLITTTGGKITTGSFGTTANTFAEGNHTHSQYLTEHQSLSDIGGEIAVEKLSTPETGYIASYVIKQNNTQVGPNINIPKDYLVKSASLETCATANTPVTGFKVGDKYIDFVINSKDNSDTDNHLYLSVSDLIDEYTAGAGLTLSSNEFSIGSNAITKAMLANAVQTSLGYADDYNSSPAKGITQSNITAWNNKLDSASLSSYSGKDETIDITTITLVNKGETDEGCMIFNTIS